jgi:hypothetical protein
MLYDPYMLMLGVWAVVAASLQLGSWSGLLTFGEISATTVVAITVGLVAWGCGDLGADIAFRPPRRLLKVERAYLPSPFDIDRRRSLIALGAILVCSVLGYGAFIRTWGVLTLAASAESFNELNVRISAREESFGGFVGRLYVLPLVGLSLTAYLRARGLLSRWLAITLVIAFILMMISPRRALLIQGVLLAVLVGQTAAGQRSYRMLGFAVVGAMVVFGVTQALLLKTQPTLLGAISPMATYVAANIPTMDALLHTPHFEDTHVVMNVPLRVLNALLLTDYPTDLAVPFIDVRSCQ